MLPQPRPTANLTVADFCHPWRDGSNGKLKRNLYHASMRWLLVGLALLSGCGDDDCCAVKQDGGGGQPMDAPMADAPTPPPGMPEVALVPTTVNRDLDILFVIDDSPSMLDKQANLKSSFPVLVNTLSSLEGGLPNIHIGVITTDMGTKGADDATPGPSVGSGPGGCASSGKDGLLQINSAPVTGAFLSDVDNGSTRVRNYTGTLEQAFSAMASVGASGCGFEQPLAAIKRSFGQAANAGFIRPTARLAIILLTDEDDCSASHSTLFGPDSATLGPLNSFRCTRFGVTCDIDGATPDEMNAVGTKSECHANETSPYVTDIGRYATFLESVKADPHDVMFGAIAGTTTPFAVEQQSPPGGGTPVNVVTHSCTYSGANGPEVADPPARLDHLAGTLRRGSLESVCGDLANAMLAFGQRMNAMVGQPCLLQDIAMPVMCKAYDEVGGTQTELPMCSTTVTTDCFRVTEDATACTSGQHLKLEVVRSSPAAAGTWTSLHCAQ